jgi:hypothetical protein
LKATSTAPGWAWLLDASKIGEGAFFTVTKWHEYAPPGGPDKAKLIVMKYTKLKFDRAGKPSDSSVFAAILAEVEILSHEPLFHHKNIATLLDIRWDYPSIYKEFLGPTLYLLDGEDQRLWLLHYPAS